MRSSRWVTVLGCTCSAAAVSLRCPPAANHASSVSTRPVPRRASHARTGPTMASTKAADVLGLVVAEQQPRHAEAGGVADLAAAAQPHQGVEAPARLAVRGDEAVALRGRRWSPRRPTVAVPPRACDDRLELGADPMRRPRSGTTSTTAPRCSPARPDIRRARATAAATGSVAVGAVDGRRGNHDRARRGSRCGGVRGRAAGRGDRRRPPAGRPGAGPPRRSSASVTERAKSSTSAVTSAPRSSVRRPARSSGSSRRSTRVATCSVPARAAATRPPSITTERPDETDAGDRFGPVEAGVLARQELAGRRPDRARSRRAPRRAPRPPRRLPRRRAAGR